MTQIYRLNQWLWGCLDWLFPPVCGGCSRIGFRWCPNCQHQVVPVPEPVCQSCGMPLSRPGICPTCHDNPPPYEALRSWVVFEGPIRHAIHSLKYGRNVALGDALAPHLAECASKSSWKVDLVVPVPLGRKRIKERGYNQVGLLAIPLAAMQGWRYKPQVLIRARETRSQVGLSPLERKENIAGAFRAEPALAAGKAILLVDDVVTTGATLAACSDALILAGARIVYALTLARALPHHGLQIV